MIDHNQTRDKVKSVLTETKSKKQNEITSTLKKYKEIAVDEMKQTRLLVRILMNAAKEYVKDKDFKLTDEDKEFIKNQSSDILKLIPLIVLQVIPGSTIATPFIIKLGEKLGMKLNRKIPEKYKKEKNTEGEMTELVDADGAFIGSNIPILNLGLHPRKTQDQTVITTRQTNNPVVRGYRVYYGESVENDDENILDESDMSGAFAEDETYDDRTYNECMRTIEELGIEDMFKANKRCKEFGFDPKLDKQLKREKRRGKCKKCFTKRRLSEIEKEKMIKMIDEIILKKRKGSDDIVKRKESDREETAVEKILKRNLESIKKIAEKEDIDINELIKILKIGE